MLQSLMLEPVKVGGDGKSRPTTVRSSSCVSVSLLDADAQVTGCLGYFSDEAVILLDVHEGAGKFFLETSLLRHAARWKPRKGVICPKKRRSSKMTPALPNGFETRGINFCDGPRVITTGRKTYRGSRCYEWEASRG